MNEVTIYDITKKHEALRGDHVEFHEIHTNPSYVSINSDDAFLACEEQYAREVKRVVQLRSDRGNYFFVWSPELERALGTPQYLMMRVNRLESATQRLTTDNIKFCNKIHALKSAGFIARLKWLFTGVK